MTDPVISSTTPEPFGVYVAAGSDEMERAKKWIAALRAKNIPVTCTWPEVIEKEQGVANPREAPLEQKLKWCLKDIQEALSSQILWLLMPTKTSFGATFEFAFFVALTDKAETMTIVSGDWKKSIFTAFAAPNVFDTDEEAFNTIASAYEEAREEAAQPPTNENAAQPKG